jgi:broad specificity phosphatase PhoE
MSGIVETMQRPEVWLVRHGETEWSASGRHTSRTDLELTDGGREAAHRISELVAHVTFTAVFTSPMKRARDTCALAGLGGPAVVDDDLREWDYGDYEGLTTAAIRADRPDWSLWRDGCPGGETADDVGARVDRVIARIRATDGPIAVFGHGHALRVLGARWVDLDATEGTVLALDTATVSRLGWEREQPVVRVWNAQP